MRVPNPRENTITIPSVFLWQALRIALRAWKANQKNPDVSGEDLRPYKSAASRSGDFLEKLVAWGLLKVTEKSVSGPLECTYRITGAGARAAEYGEWDGDPETWKARIPTQVKK